MCSLVMSLCSCDVITIHNGSKLTGSTGSKAPGFWMVEHQLVSGATGIPRFNCVSIKTQKHQNGNLIIIYLQIFCF